MEQNTCSPARTLSLGELHFDGRYLKATLNIPGAIRSTVHAINDRVELAGTYTDSSGEHAFIYDNGIVTTLNVPDATTTLVCAINDRGVLARIYDDRLRAWLSGKSRGRGGNRFGFRGPAVRARTPRRDERFPVGCSGHQRSTAVRERLRHDG